MNSRIIFVFLLALIVFTNRKAEAQRDSVKVKHEVIVESAGDTLIIVSPGHGEIDHGMGQIRIEREVMINSDGDTTMIANVMRHPMVRGRHHGKGSHRIRHRSGHARGKRNGRHHVGSEHEGRRELQKMEAEASRLARKLSEADESSYQEMEQKLRVHLEKIFDHKQAMDQERIDRERSDLEARSRTMEDRQENRDTIIEDRINQLLGRGSSYRWSP